MKVNFNGKIAVVTGASTGIGAEIAKEFGAAGAKVVVNYKRSEQAANEVVKAIKQEGGEAIAIQADVAVSSDVKRLFEETESVFGGIDILVNNAGALLERSAIEDLPEDLWDEVYNVNVKSVFLCTKYVTPLMKKRGGGSIINTASIAARNGGGGGSVHYASAKGAVLTFTKGMAKELLEHNIRVNGINPGVITTPFHDQFTKPELREKLVGGIPMGREGAPSECAGAVLFLASDQASYICGEIIEINGGQLMD